MRRRSARLPKMKQPLMFSLLFLLTPETRLLIFQRMSGIHFSFNETDHIAASFHGDKDSVTVSVYIAGRSIGFKTYTRDEAMLEGRQIADTGCCQDFALSVDSAEIRRFGGRLFEYAKNQR
jgi:hypothetical protein